MFEQERIYLVNLAELPKGCHAVIKDKLCWANEMVVYRTQENKLVVLDTIRVDHYTPVWTRDQQEKVCVVAFKGELLVNL